jgi:hypothetical protein
MQGTYVQEAPVLAEDIIYSIHQFATGTWVRSLEGGLSRHPNDKDLSLIPSPTRFEQACQCPYRIALFQGCDDIIAADSRITLDRRRPTIGPNRVRKHDIADLAAHIHYQTYLVRHDVS